MARKARKSSKTRKRFLDDDFNLIQKRKTDRADKKRLERLKKAAGDVIEPPRRKIKLAPEPRRRKR